MRSWCHINAAGRWVAGVAVVVGLGLTVTVGACAADLPIAPSAQKTDAGKTADQYRTEAQLYKHEADRFTSLANEYSEKAAAISPHQDPKGNLRNSLITAAQEYRLKADKMEQLHATNQRMADVMSALGTE